MTRSVLEAVVVANHEMFMLTSDRIDAVVAEQGLTQATRPGPLDDRSG
ncbi:hypothetical protein ACIBQX_15770 [Nonomuraea sp. NPDC049714]